MIYLLSLIADQRLAQNGRLALAAGAAALVAVAAILLLGLSGWFITGAAMAGLAGAATAQAFNVLLPSAAIRLFAIVRTGSRYVERVSGHEAALRALARLRPILFRDMATAAPEQALAVSSGEASARLVQDVDAIQTLFVRLSGPWAAAAGSAAAIGLAAMAGPAPAAVVALGLALSVGGARVIGRYGVDPAGRRTQIAVGRLKDRLSALQGAAPELRAYGLEVWAAREVERVAQDLDSATARVSLGGGWIAAWQIAVTGASVVGVVALSAGRAAPLVALAALAAVASAEAAAGLTAHFRSGGAAKQALSRLAEILGSPGLSDRGSVEGDAASLTFQAVGLILSPPQRIAIMGPTGSGKTTLVERLMGLRSGPDAEVQAPRGRFAYAAQEVRLLSGTVRSNLLLADPHADDQSLWFALEDAALADRIRRSPFGLDMSLGENGDCLSGGERRRLGLARVYLRAAPWLVLDEPTEGLDPASERLVLDRLERRLARTGQGLVLISHRPAPVRLCDIVIETTGLDTMGRVALSLATRQVAAA